MSLLPRRIRSIDIHSGHATTVAWTWLRWTRVRDPFLWQAIKPYQPHETLPATGPREGDRCPIRDCRWPVGPNGLVCDRHYVRLPKALKHQIDEASTPQERLLVARACELQFYTPRGAPRHPGHEHEVTFERYRRKGSFEAACATCGARFPQEWLEALKRQLADQIDRDRWGGETLKDIVADCWNTMPTLRRP